MSKNVAVFVDVANIFYAAKAAGVDIDYVTLLKASTAGRDFVRAYAYTGLDPENENQRQFHSFLTRSGYKVVSKDIRKYGDGRIKANLDIELVVDMMRMAQHIDIAVVVSGDGDFAPAIRAVQQMGVRVEVVSFRGNTSSDLIEVADVFTDISQLARVERGERSGRRVAAEDDLSMTAVPEKETDTGARRRRGEGRRGERTERAGARRGGSEVAVAEGSNLIVLPGERLSRAPDGEDDEALEAVEDGTVIELGGAEEDAGEGTQDQGEGRRRRRRRGGRGRGRGRRAEGESPVTPILEGEPLDEPILEDELLEEEVAPLPQHSTFGSVWESQLGVTPSTPIRASVDDEDGYDDEPEIPEYLLAERRQQGRGRGRDRAGRGPGGRGQGGGYRSAIDRERYGRAGAPTAGGYNRDRSGGQGQGRSQGRGQQQPRPQPRPAAPVRDERPSASAEPWSEVPADVQELLRAELARRQAAAEKPRPAPETTPAEPVAEVAEAPAKPTRRRTTKAAAAAEAAPAEPLAEVAEAPAKPTRRRTTKAAAETAPAEAVAEVAEAPAKPTRRRTTKAAAETAPAETVAEVAEAPAKPTRRRTTKAAAPVDG